MQYYRMLHSGSPWAYGKEKIRGAERNLPNFFRLCPSCQKKFSGPEKLSKIVVDGGGSNYEKFLLHSIFLTKLTEFPTKLTEFLPFIFIIGQYCPTVKRILPDWLCLPNKLGGCRPLRSPPVTPLRHPRIDFGPWSINSLISGTPRSLKSFNSSPTIFFNGKITNATALLLRSLIKRLLAASQKTDKLFSFQILLETQSIRQYWAAH